MKIKNKKILVYYVNIGNMDETAVKEYVKRYRKEYLNFKYNDLEVLVLPSRIKEGVEVIHFA